MMKGFLWGAVLLILLLSIQFASFALEEFGRDNRNSPAGFREVWGYLMRGEEKSFNSDAPVTDVFYFSCGVNSRGRINMNVKPPVISSLNGKKRRVHIVISELTNSDLLHFALNPANNVRDYLIDDILELSGKFDGVQIDFEAVKPEDAVYFHKFLSVIKMGLDNGKIFSVALPPRTGKVAGDPYDYDAVSKIADRIYIMAYDEHWSKSEPGPVASLPWCRDIVKHAKMEIPSEKLVMGIPLYGRAWDDRNSSRSVRARHINEIITKFKASYEYSYDTGFKITYKDSRNVVLYYDDVNATKAKFILYSGYADSVGFWRLGMENPDMWGEVRLRE